VLHHGGVVKFST